jgi:hypothetical protein
VKAGALLLLPLWFTACASVHITARRDAETVYLRTGDRAWRGNRSQPLATRAASTASSALVSTHPGPNDPLRARRAELARRVEDLPNDEADRACLTMGLIPREQIFDRGIRPKKVLRQYIEQSGSTAELDDLERTLNESRH